MFFLGSKFKILFFCKNNTNFEENMQKFAKGCVGKPRAGE